MIRRFHEAKESRAPEVTIWGTGTPRREFLYVDDLADALLHLLELDDPPDWVNVGTGKDISIQELAQLVAKIVGYAGRITNDSTKPDGTPIKCTDTSLLAAQGWSAQTGLEDGIRNAYAAFLEETEQRSLRQ